MRKRFPSMVRVLVALAMVASLVALTVAPASGQPSGVVVTAQPDTASSSARYEIRFDLGAPLTAGDEITIDFDDDISLPSSIALKDVKLYEGNTVLNVTDPEDRTQPWVNEAENAVVIALPVAMNDGNNRGVVFQQAAGIVNPQIADDYDVVVSIGLVDATGEVAIVPSIKLSKDSEVRGTAITVTGKGWTKSTGIYVGVHDATGQDSPATVDETEADGTFSVQFKPDRDGDVWVRDGSGKGTVSAPVVSTVWNIGEPDFRLKARIELDPASGAVGTAVRIKGYDFTPGRFIGQITVAGTAILQADWTLGCCQETPPNFDRIDSFGQDDDFVVEVNIPLNAAGGSNEIEVRDDEPAAPAGAGAKSAKAKFSVALPTLTLTPSTARVGDTVTVIGTNFGPNAGLQAGGVGRLLFGQTPQWQNITTNAAGSFTRSFEVPANAASGYNEISAIIGPAGGPTQARTDLLVADRLLTLQPDHGPLGTEVTLTGEDMTPDTPAIPSFIDFNALRIGAVPWNTNQRIDIDSQGKVEPTELDIPTAGVTYGKHTVVATDRGEDGQPNTQDEATAEGSFTVTQPSIEIDPDRGYRGDTITVSGEGWLPGNVGLVSLWWGPAGQDDLLLSIEPDSNGDFSARFEVPVDAADSNEVRAEDNRNNEAQTQIFTLEEPELTVDPTEGSVGSTATVTGSGFTPQFPVDRLRIGGATILPVAGLVTDELGSLEVTFTVPGLAEGSHAVECVVRWQEPDEESVNAFFTITEEEDTTEVALESCIDVIDIVWGYDEVADEWLFFDPDDPASDLEYFSVGAGYWVKASAACDLIYGGSSYSLPMGWKNIGWLGK